MNTILTKLKTSATLWGVIAGIVVGVATLQGADGSLIETISGAVITVVPLTVYIYWKFKLRIAAADTNGDGKISLSEMYTALTSAVSDTTTQVSEIKTAVETVANAVTATTADSATATATDTAAEATTEATTNESST